MRVFLRGRASWLLALAACWVLVSSCGGDTHRLERIDVRIGDVTIHAEVARTTAERADGLSNRDSLPRDAGMLFIEGNDDIPDFWMRDMRFPLDFVWISRDLRVVDVTENVYADEHNTNVADISPDEPVLYVLEVNAGVVAEEGIEEGDAVTFEPDIAVP